MAESFTNLRGLFDHINKQVQSTLIDEVVEEVIEIERYWIGKLVYNAYGDPEPLVYERHYYDGGLLDIANFDIHKEGADTVSIESHRVSNGREISKVVEYGHEMAMRTLGYGYQYPRAIRDPHASVDIHEYAYLKPRPFTKATKEDLKKKKYHVDAMQRGLDKRGIVTTRG